MSFRGSKFCYFLFWLTIIDPPFPKSAFLSFILTGLVHPKCDIVSPNVVRLCCRDVVMYRCEIWSEKLWWRLRIWPCGITKYFPVDIVQDDKMLTRERVAVLYQYFAIPNQRLLVVEHIVSPYCWVWPFWLFGRAWAHQPN